jgi:hypothetical protein
MTSITITRWCDEAVVVRRSIASETIDTAVSKPNVVSVADRSLSIVLGTPTTGTPSPPRRCAMCIEPSPPTTASASSRASRIRSTTRADTSWIVTVPSSPRTG